MKQNIVLSYRGSSASYLIRQSADREIEANLVSYTGAKKDTPRQYFYYDKQGNCNSNNTEERELMQSIYLMASQQA